MFDSIPIGAQILMVLGCTVAFLSLLPNKWIEALYLYHHPPLPVCPLGSMTASELFSMISEKPQGVVGVVVASQEHAEVVRDALLHYAIGSLDGVVHWPSSIFINKTRVLFIKHPEQILGMQFDLLLVYTVPEHVHMPDGVLRARLKPDAWVKYIMQLREEEQ